MEANMMKAKTALCLLAFAVLFSFAVLCIMTFVVLPKDVFNKSTYHVRTAPEEIKKTKLLKSSFLRGNSSNLQESGSGVGKFPIRRVIENRDNGETIVKKDAENDGSAKKYQAHSPLPKTGQVHPKIQASEIDRALLAKTLRDHGMHPERALALISNVLNDD